MNEEIKDMNGNAQQNEGNETPVVEDPKKKHKFLKGLAAGVGLAVAGLAAVAGFTKLKSSDEVHDEEEVPQDAEPEVQITEI